MISQANNFPNRLKVMFPFMKWGRGSAWQGVLGKVEIGHDYLNFIFHFLLSSGFCCSLTEIDESRHQVGNEPKKGCLNS